MSMKYLDDKGKEAFNTEFTYTCSANTVKIDYQSLMSNQMLHQFEDMEMELSGLLGCKVDLLTRRAVENSPNWILRREILDTAEVIYGAG